MKNNYKRIPLFIVLFFSLVIQGNAQSPDCNYIKTTTYLDENGTSQLVHIDYFDGLGRFVQGVDEKITPQRRDLRVVQEYDGFGRESRRWLPVPYAADGNMYDKSVIQNEGISNVYNDNRPFNENVYEPSPLNRIVTQIGSGQAWSNPTRGLSTDYLTNTPSGVLSLLKYSLNADGTLRNDNTYPSAELYVTKQTDEDSNVMYIFTDKLEKKVLERAVNGSEQLDTYYVYDDFGNQRFVLPPMIEGNISQSQLDLYAYSYKYDKRNRCIEKKLPGVDPIKYYYDKADRLIFSQDGVQLQNGEYHFRLYDAFGREVITGTTSNMNMPDLDEIVVKATYVGNAGWERTGYSINSNLNLGSAGVLTVNYYDNYNFLGLDIANGLQSLLEYDSSKAEFNTKYNHISNNVDLSAKGLLTGSYAALLDGFTGVMTVNYYDERGRIIQTRGLNHMVAVELNYYKYTFSGKVLKHQHEHYGLSNILELYTYNYDHAERLISTTHQLNGGPVVTLSENSYNELGQLSGKSNHGGLNPITYNYNIRSWMTGIHSGKFTENLSYSRHYNGNISSMSWDVGDSNPRTYNFTYDNLNRLKSAVLRDFLIHPNGNVSQRLNAYSVNIGEYDKHGNIRSLVRRGYTGVESLNTPEHCDIIDNLSLSYNGNQLVSVADDSPYDPVYHGAMHFVDGANESQEYAYDRNGNMILDKNKGIKKITYNYLNLPEVTILKNASSTNGNWFPDDSTIDENDEIQHVIDNDYNASGIKCTTSYHTLVTSAGSSVAKRVQLDSKTDYCGNIIYKNDVLDKILTPEGYIDRNENGIFVYHYYLKDHQGNNRVVINQNGTTEQVNHYYPFGAFFGKSTGGTKQPYKYNGKELERMGGLDLYDYSARSHDPILGRFTSIDPLATKYYSISPYVYCLNNPVRFVDNDGRQVAVPIPGIMPPPPIANGQELSSAGQGFKALFELGADFVKQGVNDLKVFGTIVAVATYSVVSDLTGEVSTLDSSKPKVVDVKAGRREQERRNQKSDKEDTEISKKHNKSMENNMSNNGDPRGRKPGGGKIGAVAAGTLMGVAVVEQLTNPDPSKDAHDAHLERAQQARDNVPEDQKKRSFVERLIDYLSN